ncbi:MAG TPA: heavy metal-binding protein [Firmicutes bacterium]|jgi:copper chaperone CopZ|nr:heavy metal-binding protein [Bacillota bacterium]
MTTKTYQLETLTCPSCVLKIQTALKRNEGVQEVEVLFNSSRVRVTFEETVVGSGALVRIIEALGFKVLGEK